MIETAPVFRHATLQDAPRLSHLLTHAFITDPVFDWIGRPGPARAEAFQNLFLWMLTTRSIPFGDVWMRDDAACCAIWLPPDAPPATPPNFLAQLKLLPLFVQFCGFTRLARGAAMAHAMEKYHPNVPHYYLSFVAVEPRFQGQGLGAAILKTSLAKADELGLPAYLENSNPDNARLYERLGFITQRNIAPAGAPPMLTMWRAENSQR